MKLIKQFFRHIWEGIVILQTARAAEHMTRCGRYREVRKIMLGKNWSN